MPAPRKDRELFLNLGPRLSALIEFHQTPHRKLEPVLDMSSCFLSGVCCGRKLLAANKLPLLAKFFDVTEGQLLGTEELTLTKTLHLPKL